MELSTPESGRDSNDGTLAFKSGLTSPNMRGTGSRIRPMDMESSTMLMEMCMKVNGRMIRLMVRANTHMLMELSTMETG